MIIVVVDDELLALKKMEKVLSELKPEAQIVTFQKSKDACAYVENHGCDIAFLDIEMPILSGIELAKRIKLCCPVANIIFVTGYSDYAMEAYRINASGYLLKPINQDEVQEQLECLRYPVKDVYDKRVVFKCFGNFEVFVDGEIVNFKYEKTKELLAYLVDREGAGCSNKEIMVALWEDDDHKSYLSNLKKDIRDTFKELKCEDIFVNGWGKMGIRPDLVDCDYYDWKQGKASGINAYNGEYMAQYSWGEYTKALLSDKF